MDKKRKPTIVKSGYFSDEETQPNGFIKPVIAKWR